MAGGMAYAAQPATYGLFHRKPTYNNMGDLIDPTTAQARLRSSPLSTLSLARCRPLSASLSLSLSEPLSPCVSPLSFSLFLSCPLSDMGD